MTSIANAYVLISYSLRRCAQFDLMEGNQCIKVDRVTLYCASDNETQAVIIMWSCWFIRYGKMILRQISGGEDLTSGKCKVE